MCISLLQWQNLLKSLVGGLLIQAEIQQLIVWCSHPCPKVVRALNPVLLKATNRICCIWMGHGMARPLADLKTLRD